jgi:hypothetical protein
MDNHNRTKAEDAARARLERATTALRDEAGRVVRALVVDLRDTLPVPFDDLNTLSGAVAEYDAAVEGLAGGARALGLLPTSEDPAG